MRDSKEIRGRRAVAQLLAGPAAGSAEQVARQLLAVQAQNLRSARLAVRARSAGLTAAGVNRALGEERSVVITWLCRGTLHLVCPDDYPWLLALSARTVQTANATRLAQLGVTADAAEKGVRAIVDALANDGPLPRAELGSRLRARGLLTDGQALVHQLILASYRGLIVRGPMHGAEQAFVLTRDWLGRSPSLRPEGRRRRAALGELARRYLAGHGPASPADIAIWSGLPLRDITAGLEAAAPRLRSRADGLLELDAPVPAPGRPPARLLPAFDPYLLGWKDRAYAVPEDHIGDVRLGGMIRAVATVAGTAVGTWATAGTGRGRGVEIDWWQTVAKRDRAALERESQDVLRFETRP